MLKLIWTMSLMLSALSLVVMVALIGRRLILDRESPGDAEARQRLLSALIAFSDDKNDAALKEAIRSVPEHVVLDAGFEFLALLRGEEHARIVDIFVETGLPTHMVAQLRTANEAGRIHAAEMLAALPARFGVSELLRALDRDRSREVRIAAAISLCDLDAVPALSATLRKIGIRGQRSRRLVELFKRFPADRITEIKEYAGRRDEPSFVRAAAVDALSQSGDFHHLVFLRNLAQDPSGEVSAAAIRALGRLQDSAAGPILERAMQSPDWQVRAEAAEAARRLEQPELITSLIALLDDEMWPVRYAAAKAIRVMAPQGESALRSIASGETSRRQRTASLALAEGLAA
jgi:HEAT repeat protein